MIMVDSFPGSVNLHAVLLGLQVRAPGEPSGSSTRLAR